MLANESELQSIGFKDSDDLLDMDKDMMDFEKDAADNDNGDAEGSGKAPAE